MFLIKEYFLKYFRKYKKILTHALNNYALLSDNKILKKLESTITRRCIRLKLLRCYRKIFKSLDHDLEFKKKNRLRFNVSRKYYEKIANINRIKVIIKNVRTKFIAF